MIRNANLCALLLLVLLSARSGAQRTAAYLDPDASYKTGIDLYDKRQYASAQKHFQDFAARTRSSVLKADAEFYAAACGIELFHKDSEWLMRRFTEQHPNHTKANLAYYFLGKSNFRKKKYSETLEYFDKVDLYELDKEQRAELYFKRGYAHLQKSDDEKAKSDFFEIKDKDNRYSHPANYYYSHIAYKEKKYEVALAGFNRLINDETFQSVVPYYITQIYFLQGKYEKVTQEAPKLLNDSANVQQESEINRMTGESYFHLRKYREAIPWLEKSSIGNAAGNYAIGYSYYKSDRCADAVKRFELATEGRDTIAQNAWYHMGDCFVRMGEKLRAKNAFYSAYMLHFDPVITEDALFSFAKLSYELDFNPYNEAVKAFTRYLKEYPNSKRRDEVYNFLVNVYSTTRNYEQAIKSIESLESVDVLLKVTYQKLVYFLGVDYFNNGDLANAEKQFRKSLALNSDLSLNALNQYWLGEISYIRKDYSTAIESWKKFQLMNGAPSLEEFEISNYALGYAYFHRKNAEDYSNANISFRKFLMSAGESDERKVADATIRTADCYFMLRDFAQAGEYYRKAIAMNRFDIDYALYQKSLCDGQTRNFTEKVASLKKIENDFPGSNYRAAALNEIAETYLQNLSDNQSAIAYYEKILREFPRSSYVNNSYAQLGNIYYSEKKDDKAFEYYDKFVKNDSKSEASKAILEAIKKIFDAKGDVEGQKAYFESIGNPLSENEIEKKTYLVAYDAFYNQKNCDVAMPKWESYIRQFPNGKYIVEAQFQLAECAYSKGINDQALAGYLYVTEKPRTLYHETSLAKASYLLYKDKKYQEALPLFLQLQDLAETPANKSAGRFGAMRCAFYLKDYETALTECTKVISTEKLTPQQTAEAKWIKARSLYETNRLDDALTEFRAITKNARNVTGAEAYYHIALIQFKRQEYKEVDNTISKLVSYEHGNDDWLNKGMLLLADAYIARSQLADAEVILQTIIEGKPRQEYIDEATKKLESVKAARQSQQPASPDKELNIQYKGSQRDSTLYKQEGPK